MTTATEKAAPTPALLPCPFCCGRAETWLLEHAEAGKPRYNQYQGGCAVACAETPWCDTLEEVADWWNRRANRASQEERIRESERDRIVAYLREFAKRVEPKSASANNFNAAADAIKSGHAFPAARAALGDKGAK